MYILSNDALIEHDTGVGAYMLLAFLNAIVAGVPSIPNRLLVSLNVVRLLGSRLGLERLWRCALRSCDASGRLPTL